MVKIESLFGNKYDYMLEDFKYIADSKFDFNKMRDKTVFIIGENDAINESIAFSLLLRNDLYGDNISVISVGKLNKQERDDFTAYNNFFDDFDKISAKKIDYIIFISTNEYVLPKSRKSSGTILAKNKTMVSSIMALAAKNKARMLFVSPMDIYGAVHNGFKPIKEDDTGYISLTDSQNLNGASARFAETLISTFAVERELSVSFVRLPVVYGYGRGLCSDYGRKIFKLIQDSKTGTASLPKLPDEKMSAVYLADCVRALIFILLNGENNEAYNIAFENNTVTLRDVLMTAEKLQGKNITAGEREESSYMTPCLILDGEKLKTLGLKDHLTLEQGVQRVLNL